MLHFKPLLGQVAVWGFSRLNSRRWISSVYVPSITRANSVCIWFLMTSSSRTHPFNESLFSFCENCHRTLAWLSHATPQIVADRLICLHNTDFYTMNCIELQGVWSYQVSAWRFVKAFQPRQTSQAHALCSHGIFLEGWYIFSAEGWSAGPPRCLGNQAINHIADTLE